MKKLIAIILALTCIVGLVGCSNNSMNHIIKTKPNVTGIVQEVHDDYIIMWSDSAKGYPNGSRWQISLNVENKDSYTTLTVGDEIVVYHNGQVMETEPLKVGKVFAITLKTPADRTQNEGDPTADEVAFHAKVLEVHDKYLLVEPFADSKESKSADKIEIALKEKESWPIPAVDDLVKIVYDGNIMETYPARLGKVYRVEILTIIPTEDEPQPGGTPVDEVFDITVSYANWGDLDEIYSNALNIDKIDTNEFDNINHLPIYKFDTLAELEQFKNDVKDVLSIDSGYDEVPSFNESTAKYDENFFTENTLMLVYVEASSGSYRYGVDSVYHADGNFCIHVKQTNSPEIGTDDMAGWFITVAVSDSMVADCTVFDADFQY